MTNLDERKNELLGKLGAKTKPKKKAIYNPKEKTFERIKSEENTEIILEELRNLIEINFHEILQGNHREKNFFQLLYMLTKIEKEKVLSMNLKNKEKLLNSLEIRLEKSYKEIPYMIFYNTVFPEKEKLKKMIEEGKENFLTEKEEKAITKNVIETFVSLAKFYLGIGNKTDIKESVSKIIFDYIRYNEGDLKHKINVYFKKEMIEENIGKDFFEEKEAFFVEAYSLNKNGRFVEETIKNFLNVIENKIKESLIGRDVNYNFLNSGFVEEVGRIQSFSYLADQNELEKMNEKLIELFEHMLVKDYIQKDGYKKTKIKEILLRM